MRRLFPGMVVGLIFAGVALIWLVRGTSRVKEDATIGIVFTTLFALGVVLISKNPSQVDLHHVLFGNLLPKLAADLGWTSAESTGMAASRPRPLASRAVRGAVAGGAGPLKRAENSPPCPRSAWVAASGLKSEEIWLQS